MGWQTHWAPTAAELSRCIECGLCLPHCPTFRLTGDETASPRGRLNAMKAAAAGFVPLHDSAFAEIISLCLQCRACEATCPSMVPFGRAMEGSRAEIVAARPAGRLRRRLTGRWLATRPLVRAGTLGIALLQRLGALHWLPGRFGRAMAGIRHLPWRRRSTIGGSYPPQGDEIGVAGLLSGCVMDPWFAAVHDASIDLLCRCGYRVVVPRSQTCCGALAAHEGAAADARRLAARNVGAFAGLDVIVADAAGCSAHLKGYAHWAGEEGDDLAARTRDITEIVAEAISNGRLPHLDPTHTPVAVQDPCHLRHAQRLLRPPRLILEAAGYRPVEIDPDGLCCGAAGLYSLVRPDTSHELGIRMADQIQGSGALVVASANPGCEMHMRAHLGSGIRVAHPVELYAEALNAVPSSPKEDPSCASSPTPTLSESSPG